MPIPWAPGRHTLIPDHASRGITVKQLRDFKYFLQRLCCAGLLNRDVPPAAQEQKCSNRIAWFDLNMYDICDEVVKPVIRYQFPDFPADPITGRQWFSWVELVAESRQPPLLFFSHWWGGCFRDFVYIVETLCKDSQLSINSSIWICTFALCQFGEDLGATLDQCPFRQGLDVAISTVLVVDRQAGSLDRTWCGFEMQLTAKSGKHLDIYTPAGRVGSDRASSGPLLDALEQWDITVTETSQPTDRRQILNYVAGVDELAGLHTDATGKLPVVVNGFKQLSDERPALKPRQVRSGKSDYAYEEELVHEREDAFAKLNQLVREKALASIGKAQLMHGCLVEDRGFRGLTLAQLRAFAREVRRKCNAEQLVFTHAETGQKETVTWTTIRQYHLRDLFIEPMTKQRCCSYMELVSGGAQRPQYFVEDTPNMFFADVMAAIDWMAEARHLSDTAAFFFIELSINRHNEQADFQKLIVEKSFRECSAMLFCCDHFRENMRRARRYENILRATQADMMLDLGCCSGVLACTRAFEDGGQEFGHFDSAVAEELFCMKCTELTGKPGVPDAVRNMIGSAFPRLCQVDALRRFEQRVVRLAVGPMLRAAAAHGAPESVFTIQKICLTPGLRLSSRALKGGLGEDSAHVAAAMGHTTNLRTLLELKADPDAEDVLCERPLHHAALAGSIASIHVLLAAGADPAAESIFGETPLDVAVQNPAGFLRIQTEEIICLLGVRLEGPLPI